MSNPGPSQVSAYEKNEEIVTIYSEMTDDAILTHIRALLEEVAIRPALNKSIPSLNEQLTDEIGPAIDPKTECLDEEYLVLHEKSSGIEYNHLNGSFTCNSRFSDNNDIRRTNELNNYGRHLHIPPDPSSISPSSFFSININTPNQKSTEKRTIPFTSSKTTTPRPSTRPTPLSTKPSAKYWNKKGGEPNVNCQCSLCHRQFTSLRALLDHRLETHSEDDMLTCGICQKTFTTRTHMHLHLSQEYKLHHCATCNLSFSSNWHKIRHNCCDLPAGGKIDNFEVKEEIDDDGYGDTVVAGMRREYRCDLCGKRYSHEHWKIKHQEKCQVKPVDLKKNSLEPRVQEFKCTICLRQYSSQYWFDCHKKKCTRASPTPTVILPGIPTARCHLCGKIFQNERSLEYHLRHCRAKHRAATQHATPTATRHATHSDMPVLENYSIRRIVGAEPILQRAERIEQRRRVINAGAEFADEPIVEAGPNFGEAELIEEMKPNLEEAEPTLREAELIEIIEEAEFVQEAESMEEGAEPILEIEYMEAESLDRAESILEEAEPIEERPLLVREWVELPDEGAGPILEEAEPIDEESDDDEEEEYEDGPNPLRVPMECSKCHKMCRGVSSLLTHRQNQHGTQTMLTCHICNTQFNSISTIRRHLNQEYSLYKCPKCSKNCKDNSDRRDHICAPPGHLATPATVAKRRLSNVPVARKCVKCPTCFESFATSTIMYNHRMTCDPRKVSISEERRRRGAELGRSRFESSTTMEGEDEEEEPIIFQILQCPECPSQFNYLSEIARHRHETHGKQQFECLFCTKHFAILRTLQDHHTLEIKRWTCRKCQRPFCRRYQMEYHEAYCIP